MFNSIALKKLAQIMAKGYLPSGRVGLTNPKKKGHVVIDEYGKVTWYSEEQEEIKFHI